MEAPRTRTHHGVTKLRCLVTKCPSYNDDFVPNVGKLQFPHNEDIRMSTNTRIGSLMLAVMAMHAAAAHATISCTEMADAANAKPLVREGQCDQRVTSGSTFKIAISLMGYDSGILRDEHRPTLAFHKGYVDWFPEWRTPTDPAKWMKDSVVWYSQQTTHKLGEARFQRYVRSFNFGNMDVSGDPGQHNGLDYAWISSSLQISADEQVVFLTNLVNRKLPVSPKAHDMTARILKRETLANGWEIYGKTGSGSPVLPNGKSDDVHAYGWFVGWATKGQRTIVFARLVQDEKKEAGRAGLRVRDAFMRELPARLDAL
jgi:bla regulator protein blaR1